MLKIVAPTLEEAYKKASQAYDCSIVDLDIEVIQSPSRGILGLFKKDAIINARHKNEKDATPAKQDTAAKPTAAAEQGDDRVLSEIREGLEKLIESSCFDAYVQDLSYRDGNIVDIVFDGEDAALMIGKEGYRYKALSYILHNWIKVKYGLNSTLEIASFLKTQRESIERYLDIFAEKVEERGRAQTKPLDGILVKLALEGLRARYPDKYVAIRTLKNGRKVIIVNHYNRKDER